MTASAFALIGTVIVAILGGAFGLYQARSVSKSAAKANDSATATKFIEFAVKDLVDQYRERNEELLDDVHEVTEKCKVLEKEVKELRKEVSNLRGAIDEKDTEILRLKHELGEPII